MIASSILTGLLFMVGVPLGIALAVVTLVRGLRIPRSRREGATCGKCGYGIDLSAAGSRCSECGSDLNAVGVASPHMAARFRSGAFQVYGSWALLCCVLGSVAGYIALLVSMASSGALNAATQPTTTTDVATITPAVGGVAPEIELTSDLTYSFGGTVATSGTLTFAVERADDASATEEMVVEVRTMTVRGPADGVAPTVVFGSEALDAFFEDAGYITEGEAYATFRDQLVDGITLGVGQPYAFQASLATPTSMGGAAPGPTSYWVTVNNSTTTGFGPTAVFTDGWIASAVIGGVWLIVTAGGFVWIALRRHRLLALA